MMDESRALAMANAQAVAVSAILEVSEEAFEEAKNGLVVEGIWAVMAIYLLTSGWWFGMLMGAGQLLVFAVCIRRAVRARDSRDYWLSVAEAAQ